VIDSSVSLLGSGDLNVTVSAVGTRASGPYGPRFVDP